MKDKEVKEPGKRTQKNYSLAFKLAVIAEVEKGALTYKQAQVNYGIQGRSTVLVWLRKHGRINWESSPTMKKDNPAKKTRELEAKLKRLEQEKELLNRANYIADEQFATDIRKKYLPLLSKAADKPTGETKASPLD